jgi:hypothetical protein
MSFPSIDHGAVNTEDGSEFRHGSRFPDRLQGYFGFKIRRMVFALHLLFFLLFWFSPYAISERP